VIAPSIAQARHAACAGQARQIRLASSIWRGAALSCRPGGRGLLRRHSREDLRETRELVFDRCPDARVILGHMGEFLPFQLSRLDSRYEVLDFKHPLEKLPSEYFRTNVAITTTGVFSHAALIAAIQEVGVDNVMFSIDYPFESTGKAVQFIRTAPLAPVDQERVAHVNAERILRLNQ
jgi:predicted TIM-barrel fold metal-dependent hydrolase